jgi:hypothetical protein
MKVLEKYADEVRGEAEKKAEEKAAKQMDFGGLDEDKPKDQEETQDNPKNKIGFEAIDKRNNK